MFAGDKWSAASERPETDEDPATVDQNVATVRQHAFEHGYDDGLAGRWPRPRDVPAVNGWRDAYVDGYAKGIEDGGGTWPRNLAGQSKASRAG